MLPLVLANNGLVVTIVIVLPLVALGAAFFASTQVFICGPDEVLVLAGRTRTLRDGSVVGYRVIKGGRTFRFPFLEDCRRFSLVPLTVQLEGDYVLAEGGTAAFEIDAQVQVAPSEPALTHAIERFLGQDSDEIVAVAGRTLTGCLAALVARHSSTDLERIKELQLKDDLLHEAKGELLKLGLQLNALRLTRAS